LIRAIGYLREFLHIFINCQFVIIAARGISGIGVTVPITELVLNANIVNICILQGGPIKVRASHKM